METTPPQKTVEDLLGSVPTEKSFRLNNGGSISSLRQLYSALQNMDQGVFTHHVNDSRNDFGSWVKDIHKDYRLANALFNSESKKECAAAVSNRIYELEKISEPKTQKVAAPDTSQIETKKEFLPAPVKQEKIIQEPVNKVTNEKNIEKKSGFNKEEAIATAILERNPIDHLIEPRKKKKIERPKPEITETKKEKNEMETAAERLEKILSDAAKTKIAKNKSNNVAAVKQDILSTPIHNVKKEKLEVQVEKEENTTPKVTNTAFSTSTITESKEQSKVTTDDPLFEVPPVADDAETEDVIKLIKEKSFAGQLKSDMKSIFSKGSMTDLANDMKKITPSALPKENAEDKTPETPITGKQVSGRVTEKDAIIAHLKKVYGQ